MPERDQNSQVGVTPEPMGTPAIRDEEAPEQGKFAKWKLPAMIGTLVLAAAATWYVSATLQSEEEAAQQGPTKAASLITSTEEYVRQRPPREERPPRRPTARPEPAPQPTPQLQPVKTPEAPPEKVVVVREERPRPVEPQGPTLSDRRLAAPMMAQMERQIGPAAKAPADEGQYTEEGKFEQMFKGSKLRSGSAHRVKNRALVLPKGTFINCIMETAVDTTVPGMTSCRIPENVFSMDGRTLLIEAGSRAFGEYRGAVAQGLDRIFMLWTQVETPHGVIIDLDSPATDSLGRSGVTGEVDHHWWARFGNALLFSIIDDGFQFAMEKASDNDNSISYSNTDSGMSQFLAEVMRETGQIPPTILMNQGTRVGIFVARNIDMSSVYQIEADDGIEERP